MLAFPSGARKDEHGANTESAVFQFMSAHRCVRATGVAEWITMPAHAEGREPAQFQAHVQAALERARSRGIAHPIVIGALPFDLRQPVSLAIPQSYEFFKREDQPAVAQSAQTTLPQATYARSVPEEIRFRQGVQQAIANFHFSDIRKVVLSRLLEVGLAENIDPAQLFARLLAQNPGGYQFRMRTANGAELIGASPELLLRKHAGRIYSNPLAGSARRQATPALDQQVSQDLLHSDKDLYEHSLVIEDLQRVMQTLCSELTVPATPSLISTASMWHLSTEIDGIPADPAMSVLELACQLHPTPALCGYPTQLARKLISLVEPFERGLFGGMVGWCDAEGEGEWAVSIRCGLVQEKQVQLFAGAGIVAASCPESEWAETQAKLQTMLNALGIDIQPAEKHSTAQQQTQQQTQQQQPQAADEVLV